MTDADHHPLGGERRAFASSGAASPPVRPADLPPELLARAREFYATGATPVRPKAAATVLLLRPGTGGPAPAGIDGLAQAGTGVLGPAGTGDGAGVEVYAIRRVSTMAFAAGMYAFPGGTVDARDAGADIRWAGPGASEWARRLGLTSQAAQATVCAAVREVFEEAGVLLAGTTESTVVGDVSDDDWESQRAALVARRLGFADLLRARDLALRADLLAPWGRWITPEFEPRRYDTHFFLARLPHGQVTRNVGGEADETRWLRPADRAGLPMLMPTRATLAQLAAYQSIDELIAVAATRDAATPVIPHFMDA